MKQLRITVDGKSYDVSVELLDSPAVSRPAPAAVVRAAPAASVVTPVPSAPKHLAAAGQVVSPLAGIVKGLDVAVGAKVKAGDLVLTLEAMKMFTSMNAPHDGTVTEFHVASGDSVDEGQPLYTIV